jgi:predicted HAD superfamily phosphohydrolase YqeG
MGMEILARFVAVFGKGRIFVLSNTRTVAEERRCYYEEHTPSVVWLDAERKPSADGLRQVAERVGVGMEKIAVIDDGLLTGVLMGVENGAYAIYAERRDLREGVWPKMIRLSTTRAQLLVYFWARLLERV